MDDGAQLVSWVEQTGSDYQILLRRISGHGTLSVPVQLARLSTDPGHPRLTRIKDEDATPAQLLLAHAENATPITRILTLRDARLLAEAGACDCDPRPEDQRGYAIKGRITQINPDLGTLVLTHDAIPGLMKGAHTRFHASPDVLASLSSGQRILARTEKLGADWWLFFCANLSRPKVRRHRYRVTTPTAHAAGCTGRGDLTHVLLIN